MDMVNTKVFIEITLREMLDGKWFQYPIPTYLYFRDLLVDTENNTYCLKWHQKYGTPLFSNYVNSIMVSRCWSK